MPKKRPSPFADIYETRIACDTQAYMLVYLREDMRNQVLAPPTLDDIPAPLKEIFDKENDMLDDM